MALDLGVFRRTLGIHREHRNAGLVRCLHRRADRQAVARHKDDGGDAAGNEIIHLIGLFFHVHIRIHYANRVTIPFGLSLNVVADDLEKRVGKREWRVGDHTLAFSGLALVADSAVVFIGGRCIASTATAAEPGGEADYRE